MNWTSASRVRLRNLFARRDLTGRPELPMLSVYRDYGVVLREGREDNYNKPGEDLSAYRVVRCGDLVLNKMKTWQGSLGISNYDGIVSPAYFVARPLSDDYPKFLHYLLRSNPLIAEYAARSKGIRPSQWDLPWEQFQDIRVDLPHVATQKVIADYLDRETARIDAVIGAKQRIARLLEERLRVEISEATVE
jgi:type I restriction enzyme, S subunit